jgi:hypothetical protein
MSFKAIWKNQGSVKSPDGMLQDSNENKVKKTVVQAGGSKGVLDVDWWPCKSSEGQQGVNCSNKVQSNKV